MILISSYSSDIIDIDMDEKYIDDNERNDIIIGWESDMEEKLMIINENDGKYENIFY